MSTDIAKTVKITVDGHQIDVPENALLLEALKLQGLDIPNFCYYWNLPAQASCRMCLVRIEKVPRLQPSCTTYVRDGMVVETNTAELVDMRRGMLEFMLANQRPTGQRGFMLWFRVGSNVTDADAFRLLRL